MQYYNIQHTENGIIITNNSLENLKYTLNLEVCNDFIKRAEGTIKPSAKVELRFMTSDGNYSLDLLNSFVTEKESFVYYGNTIKMIVDNIEKLCGSCGCKDTKNGTCKDSTDSCNTLLQPLTMSLAYYFLNPSRYNNILDYLSDTLDCNIKELLSCLINTNAVIGRADYKELAEQLAVAFYATFYVDALLVSSSVEETLRIKNLFKSEKLASCVRKYGLDLKDMIDFFIDNSETKVFYWQSPSIDYSIETLDSVLTPEFLALQPSSNLERFQNGVTVPLNTIGKLIFVVREITNVTLIIEDALGNNVTSSFETLYNPALKAKVYLSKMPYTLSNIFFKFKHIINE